jgi:hypothetical protein
LIIPAVIGWTGIFAQMADSIQNSKRPGSEDSLKLVGVSIDPEGRICFDDEFIAKIRSYNCKRISDAFGQQFGYTLFSKVRQFQKMHPDYKKRKKPIEIKGEDSIHFLRPWTEMYMHARFVNIDNERDTEMLFSFNGFDWRGLCFMVAKKIDGIYRSVFIDYGNIGTRFEDSIMILNAPGPGCIFGIETENGAGPEEWFTYDFYKTNKKGNVEPVFEIETESIGDGPIFYHKALYIDSYPDSSKLNSIKVHYVMNATFNADAQKLVNISPKSKGALDSFYVPADDDQLFDLLKDTFSIVFTYNNKSGTYDPDFKYSDINAQQFEVLTDIDLERYNSRKKLKKMFISFSDRIQKNASGNPDHERALKWLKTYLDLK